MGGCQNYGPFLGPYYNTAPIIQGTPKGTSILTTTHIMIQAKFLNQGVLGSLGKLQGLQGLESRAWGVGFREQGLGFKGLGFRV